MIPYRCCLCQGAIERLDLSVRVYMGREGLRAWHVSCARPVEPVAVAGALDAGR